MWSPLAGGRAGSRPGNQVKSRNSVGRSWLGGFRGEGEDEGDSKHGFVL